MRYEIGELLNPKTGEFFRFIYEGGGIKDSGIFTDIEVKKIKVEEGRMIIEF